MVRLSCRKITVLSISISFRPMAEMNRTVQSIKNARVSLFFSVLVLVLGFFSRKILIDCLGAEVLGLNTTATNLLGFLNLAELGISAAISYTLYTPLFQKDYETINEIVAVQGWLYRRIAYIVLAGGAASFHGYLLRWNCRYGMHTVHLVFCCWLPCWVILLIISRSC